MCFITICIHQPLLLFLHVCIPSLIQGDLSAHLVKVKETPFTARRGQFYNASLWRAAASSPFPLSISLLTQLPHSSSTCVSTFFALPSLLTQCPLMLPGLALSPRGSCISPGPEKCQDACVTAMTSADISMLPRLQRHGTTASSGD